MLDEDTPQHPINSYGASKKAIEEILKNFGAAYGLNHVIFRYFNVAGADPEAEVGEQHRPETHLIPLMLDAIEGRRPALTVFGQDYPDAGWHLCARLCACDGSGRGACEGAELAAGRARQPGVQPWHRAWLFGATGD